MAIFTRAVLGGLIALLQLVICQAKTVTYDFNVTWVNANPDGLHERKVVGVNGQWPLPIIEVNKGDRLVVNLFNGLGDKDTSIHFHGMYQNTTNPMDGPAMVTQCPLPPGHSITYDFEVNQNGTYWYHCHTDNCYPDGQRQALIVHDDQAYFASEYEDDLTITMSDWYHALVEDRAKWYLSPQDSDGAEPVPNSFLFNDTMNSSIPVKPNTTYMLRFVNLGAFVSEYIYIEGHSFKIVEVDGVYTEPTEAHMLYIGAGQRYSVLLTTKNTTIQNFPIVMIADSELLDSIPSNLQLNYTNWLEYNASAAHPIAKMPVDEASDLDPFDDFNLVPYDRMPLLPEPDHTIKLQLNMLNVASNAQYSFFNNITYTKPKVPTLYTAMSSGNMSSNAQIYGDYTNTAVLKHNDVVELILNNNDDGSHPFHLHGHNFQIINRSPSYGSHFYDNVNNGDSMVPYGAHNHTAFPSMPSRRDTLILPPYGYFVIRWVADNPGVWFFHCHIDWHLSGGLAMPIVEAPEQLQQRSSVPKGFLDVCRAKGIPTEGNAAGNTADLLDLRGQPEQPVVKKDQGE